MDAEVLTSRPGAAPSRPLSPLCIRAYAPPPTSGAVSSSPRQAFSCVRSFLSLRTCAPVQSVRADQQPRDYGRWLAGLGAWIDKRRGTSCLRNSVGASAPASSVVDVSRSLWGTKLALRGLGAGQQLAAVRAQEPSAKIEGARRCFRRSWQGSGCACWLGSRAWLHLPAPCALFGASRGLDQVEPLFAPSCRQS